MAKVPSRTVHVTQEIINLATPENSARCVLAQALRHIGATSTRVTADNVSFNKDNKRYTYSLPAKAAVELVRFDEGKSIKPFKFTLHGNCGTVMDVVKKAPYGPYKKKAKTKRAKRKSKSPRFCVRRFHGIRIIQVPTSGETANGRHGD